MNIPASHMDQTLVGHWRGKAPLRTAYWVVGALGGVVAYCAGVFGLLVSSAFSSTTREIVTLLVFAGLLGYASFACVAIWRCWKNSSWIVWGYFARIHVVLFALTVLLGFVAVLTGNAPVV